MSTASPPNDRSPEEEVFVEMYSPEQVQAEEDNRSFVAFIKAFAPVLLHLSNDNNNNDIKDIINEFKELSESADPEKTKTDRLRGWVDSKMEVIGNMTQDEIDNIFKTEKLKKLEIDAFHKNEYALQGKRKHGDSCLITMDPIRRDEYYVDFLDNGKPYKVNAIVEYYKRLKLDNVSENEWKTPLRNPITEEERLLLEDLEKWYSNAKMCTRSKIPKLHTNAKSPVSKSPSTRKIKKTTPKTVGHRKTVGRNTKSPRRKR
jgi:hypothetical protein